MKTNGSRKNESKLHKHDAGQFNNNLKLGANELQQGTKLLRRRFLH